MSLILNMMFLFLAYDVQSAPLAPNTADGATPIVAQVSAIEFKDIIATTQHSQPEQKNAVEVTKASGNAFKVSLFPTPEKTAESVKLEQEATPSKVLSVYDNSQKKLSDLTNPVPILDTINEYEKYGNNGDMYDGISRTLVNGFESFSNLLNTIIQKPKEVVKSISRGITAQLDIIGGKLVGL